MRINSKCSFVTCNNCGTHFQELKDLEVEHEDEYGTIFFKTEKTLDVEKTEGLTLAHAEAGCKKRAWSWDEIEYYTEEEEEV